MEINKNYYVYVLLDSSVLEHYHCQYMTFLYKPFYVGKGIGNRINDTIYDKGTMKSSKIKSLKNKGVKIIQLKIIENISDIEALNIEIELIKHFGRRDLKTGILTNMTDGGDGRLTSPHTIETRQKISASLMGVGLGRTHSETTIANMKIAQHGNKNGFFGKQHTEETKLNHSNLVSGVNHPMYGKQHDTEMRKKLVEARSKFTPEMMQEAFKHFKKDVNMYDLNMNYIKTFESVKAASSELATINESIISKCCRGEIKAPTRYFFRYVDKYNNIKSNKYLVENTFNHNNEVYTIIERFTSKTLVSKNNEEVLLSNTEIKFVDFKDTNDIYFVELFMFLKSIDKNFKIDKENYTISNGVKTFNYYKLYNNSEIFKNNKYIYNKYIPNVYHIFEDIFINKTDIVKSRIRNILHQTPNKIYGRKCEIYIPNMQEVRGFLKHNHIQGFVRYKYVYCLKYNGEIVSLMSFGNLRKSMGSVSEENTFEMLRYCSKLNTNVIGAASKLFNHFINNVNISKVISYADCAYSSGDLYSKLGFTYLNRTIPNYFYIIDHYTKEYRFKHRKDILVSNGGDPNKTEVEIQHGNGYYRIWDCGSLKYEYINKEYDRNR